MVKEIVADSDNCKERAIAVLRDLSEEVDVVVVGTEVDDMKKLKAAIGKLRGEKFVTGCSAGEERSVRLADLAEKQKLGATVINFEAGEDEDVVTVGAKVKYIEFCLNETGDLNVIYGRQVGKKVVVEDVRVLIVGLSLDYEPERERIVELCERLKELPWDNAANKPLLIVVDGLEEEIIGFIESRQKNSLGK